MANKIHIYQYQNQMLSFVCMFLKIPLRLKVPSQGTVKKESVA